MKEFDFLQFNNSETQARIVWKDQSVTEFLPLRSDRSVVYEGKIYTDEGYIPDEEYSSTSWLNGIYHFDEADVTINTCLSFVSVEFKDSDNYCFQGQEADIVIKDILHIFCTTEKTNREAVKEYINLYL